MIWTTIAIAFLATAVCTQAAVYKCTEPDGSLTYSDKPCADAPSEKVQMHDQGHRAPAGSVDPLESQRRMAEEWDRQREAEVQKNINRRRQEVLDSRVRELEAERLRNARIEGRIVKGMSEDHVKDILGRPDHINRSSRDDQWVYYDGDESQYVYVRDGKVTGWQRYNTDDR